MYAVHIYRIYVYFLKIFLNLTIKSANSQLFQTKFWNISHRFEKWIAKKNVDFYLLAYFWYFNRSLSNDSNSIYLPT